VFSLTPGGSEDFDNFITQNLADYAVPDRPGLHRTSTLDFDIVLAGEVVLELEDDHEVTLCVGDIVVQNGTRHRWVNRGSIEARIAAVTIGADHKLSA
jgi:mannose-6-phosphate isomerase-like protein (cupin superfamily)